MKVFSTLDKFESQVEEIVLFSAGLIKTYKDNSELDAHIYFSLEFIILFNKEFHPEL